MFDFDNDIVIYGKEKLHVGKHELKTAIELENSISKNDVGFILDASTSNLINLPLGENDVNVSGYFSKSSRVLDFLKAKPGTVQEYIDELKANRSQYYLHQIMVSKNIRGEGAGTKMMELSEYLYAKYLKDNGLKSGFITGTFCPIGEKEDKVRGFYEKNGFILTETGELFKDVLVEEVMDRDNREVFEKIF